MIRLFTGTLDDLRQNPIRGNGKTNFCTFFLFLDFLHNREILTNYETSFSTVISSQEIVELILSGQMNNISVGIDEIQIILNSIGSKKDVVLFCDKCFSQSRKRGIDIDATTQRYKNVHLRFRVQTDIVYIPVKRHLDGTKCVKDRCQKDHILYLYQENPKRINCIFKLRPELIGRLYDSNQIMDESLSFKNSKPKKSEDEILQEKFRNLSDKEKKELLNLINQS